MAEKLVKHLYEKADEHRHLKLLQSQWNFDEELIPKALQNISTIFPHYSRHDASHSRQILINIERLLGENIKSLTATDTWLILEAAYWHDIGMLVTAEDISTDMKSEKFKQYLYDVSTQDGHELSLFARQFSSLDTRNCFSAAETPQQAMELYRQLLAGWYRAQHPQRAAEIIDNPWLKSGINSPRTELVPRRLFLLLGQICRMHGSSFESILETLPLCEAGMATENCHPRFVSCLLRLGDLFDLDDNRFCPVMLRVAGDIPLSSQAHIDKHVSIRRISLDPNRVEITAECQSYEGYEVTDQWFRWIEEEFRKQMTHWNDIVPDREFGLLPTLGKLEVNLAPPNEILSPGQRPRFGVDQQQTIELLQGAGIYDDRWQSIRELLQNAVDVTLIRIWLTHKENSDSNDKNLDWNNPKEPRIKDIFNNYPISVTLQKCPDSLPGKVLWQLEIKDSGIGISKQDLKYMKAIGSSSKNGIRKTVISKMPNWMRPSGAFGIGLQSAFLLSSEIKFETKSMIGGDELSIRMASPIGPQKGHIFIQRSPVRYGRDYGTLLSLKIETEQVPRYISYSYDEKYVKYTLDNFDPIRMTELHYVSARIVDGIIKFAEHSPIPINLTFNDQVLGNVNNVQNSEENIGFYCPESGIQLLSIKFILDSNQHRSAIYFRGQFIEKYLPRLYFVAITADILSDSAQSTLALNRNDVKETAKKHVYDLLISTIVEYLKSDNSKEMTSEERTFASAFLFWHAKDDQRKDLKDNWLDMRLPQIGKTINEICIEEEFKIYLLTPDAYGRKPEPPAGKVSMEYFKLSEPSFDLFLRHWHNLNGYVQMDLSDDLPYIVLTFSKKEISPFSDSYLRAYLISEMNNSFAGGRFCMPSWGKFKKLSVKLDDLPLCHSISRCHRSYEHFIVPFFYDKRNDKITFDGLSELYSWTRRNATDPDLKEQEIPILYEEFIKWMDDLMKDNEDWRKLRQG
jgi:hypothetical protein